MQSIRMGALPGGTLCSAGLPLQVLWQLSGGGGGGAAVQYSACLQDEFSSANK